MVLSNGSEGRKQGDGSLEGRRGGGRGTVLSNGRSGLQEF